MADGQQESAWVIRPSLWFDAVCLIPLLVAAIAAEGKLPELCQVAMRTSL